MKSLSPKPFRILLADDDRDDRFFFEKALEEISIPTGLVMIEDGEKLMTYLTENVKKLPDVLFLDLNMPRKNGSECLSEIKQDARLKHIPVIIYSTSLHEDVADLLYRDGAHFYVRKTDFFELKKILKHMLQLIKDEKFARPTRNKFIANLVEI